LPLLVGLLLGLLAVGIVSAGTDILVDFEGGLPTTWFVFSGGGATVSADVQVVGDTDPLARPGQTGDNAVLASTFDATSGFAGFGDGLGGDDWSSYTGVSFWFYGSNTGQSLQFEIQDNRSDPSTDTAERFDYDFLDDFSGWQKVVIPFSDFTRATDYQPPGAPDDGLTLTEMWGWAVVLDGAAGTLYMDDVGLERRIVDDFEFEGPLPSGSDGDGVPIGFYTFQDASSSVAISKAGTPPAPELPATGTPNNVIQIDLDVVSFAGFIHAFENETVDTWLSQDWSDFGGFAVWIYGNNSGTSLFIDLLENRNPGSTTDDAERWTVTFDDDFSGWRYFEFPFDEFARKGVGNGAPDDGLTLEEVHGWAFGTLGTGGPLTYYLDEASLFGTAVQRPLEVTYSVSNYEVVEGNTAVVTVKLTRSLAEGDPAQVSVDYSTEPGSATPDRDYLVPAPGTLTFVQGGPSEQTFTVETLQDGKFEGDETVILRLSNPVDIPLGFNSQARITILDVDAFDLLLIDDFERWPYQFYTEGGVTLAQTEIAAGDPMAVPGQGPYEGVLEVTPPIKVDIKVEGNLCPRGNGVIPVILYTTDSFDATTVDHTTVMLGNAYETHVDRKTGLPRRHEEDADRDGDIDLVFHFRANETGLDCDAEVVPFSGMTYDGRTITADGAFAFGRDFALGQDWSLTDGLSFWYYGTGSGDTIYATLKDNRAPDDGSRVMLWSDEFDDPAGTPPNPSHWTHEIGDGTVNGIPGWGNSELQYYTDSTENSATDGEGNLVITVKETDGSLACYYGPCEYTSARLISQYKAEFAYGRIEARIQVPDGGPGLWPAFWSLGTDIGVVGWPQTGEIDIMEYVSREPYEVFGTIHGPGYSGGNAFGNIYTFDVPVYEDYRTFAIEWGPDEIHWYVDGINYHNATPGDVAPNQWVFNHPFFLIMNVAVGGNFGGPVGDDTTFPQMMEVDYVRAYGAPDTAERWEAPFVDDFVGWQLVEIPFDAFSRSADQPEGAPDDGLNLTEVWGYGFHLPGGTSASTLWFDQVRLLAPTALTVTNTNDSGAGSLRQSIAAIASGGTVSFDPGLAGSTIMLSSGPLVVSGKTVTVDASAAPGITLSGGGSDRVLIVDAGATANLSHLTLADGYGWQLAGGILNNGTLSLDHATVTNNVMATDAGDFWQGGGGIYNGDGATLYLVDSTVSDNTAAWSGGGVYSFFNTTTLIERSTISGNVSNDVGGGIRMLGNATIVNSTLSGNTSTGWYGGAIFHTDGVMDMVNSTVANNVAPDYAPAAVFVGTFTDASATLNLTNSIVANNVTEGCFLAPFGAGAVAINSAGHNLASDGTCFLTAAGDQPNTDPLLAPLADNGGPTQTHALSAGSPAIDAADAGVCPATDQRGIARPQGAGCDVGAYELVP
jgi:beta-glucanase (GH16 family)